MGLIGSSRCDLCHGTGDLKIKEMDQTALFEWIEGYMDEDTSDEWLINQLNKLIKERAKLKRKK